MKKIIFTAFALASLTFVACEKHEDMVKPRIDSEQANFLKPEPDVTLSVSWSWHRGAKWSTANNVDPCTAGLGICDFTISRSGDPRATISFLEEYDDVNNQGKMVIKFLDEVPNSEDIFITAEEDIANLELPTEVCNYFGCTKITIIPKDYTLIQGNGSGENPFGYVVVDVITD